MTALLDGTMLGAEPSSASPTPVGTEQLQISAAYDTQLATQLQAMIDRALGPGSALVTVNAVLNFSTTKTTTQRYTSNPTTPPLAQQKVTGPGASNTVNSALGTVSQTVQSAPAQVQRLSIAVLLDKTAKNVNVATISKLVKAGVGFRPTRGDSLSVQVVPFNKTPQLAATRAANAAANQAAGLAASAHTMQLIKWAAFGLLAVALTVGTVVSTRRRRTASNR